jgi:hypothetical protein
MSEIYPEFEYGDFSCNYYVEFDRSGEGTFTLFKRYSLYSKEEWRKLGLENSIMTNEVHPYNILTAGYGPAGAMPDKNWVKFMVDALNRNS